MSESRHIEGENGTGIVQANPEQSLALLSQARQLLANLRTVEEVLAFRDQVEAVRHYRQVAGHAVEACNEAAEVKVRAERRIGELLGEMPKQHGARPADSGLHGATPLSDLGIEKTQSHRWQALASLPEELFEVHIAEVKEAGEQLTTAGLLRLAKQQQKNARKEEVRSNVAESTVSLESLIADGRKFRTVYADPPWIYDNQGTRGATSDHYVGMSVEEIAAMPVADLVEKDAHLHLWTTNAFLEASFNIIRAWGFEFRSTYIWCKPQIGMGNYWRCSHEFLLTAIRGSCPFEAHNLISWGVFDRGAHSAKPEQVRILLEKASVGPYLELFGRKAVPGWTVFGNQVERDLFTQNTEGFDS